MNVHVPGPCHCEHCCLCWAQVTPPQLPSSCDSCPGPLPNTGGAALLVLNEGCRRTACADTCLQRHSPKVTSGACAGSGQASLMQRCSRPWGQMRASWTWHPPPLTSVQPLTSTSCSDASSGGTGKCPRTFQTGQDHIQECHSSPGHDNVAAACWHETAAALAGARGVPLQALFLAET